MISMTTLTFIIASFCQFKDPSVPRDYKESCMEFIVNCAIVKDGQSSNKIVDECRERWVENVRSKR